MYFRDKHEPPIISENTIRAINRHEPWTIRKLTVIAPLSKFECLLSEVEVVGVNYNTFVCSVYAMKVPYA